MSREAKLKAKQKKLAEQAISQAALKKSQDTPTNESIPENFDQTPEIALDSSRVEREKTVGDPQQDEEEKGVPVPINVKGGCCAAIMALLVTKRLLFDIIIPDQMIIIDNQSTDYLKRDKLLEKVKHHEMITGKEFTLSTELGLSHSSPCADEDIYMDKDLANGESHNLADSLDKETACSKANLDNEEASNEVDSVYNLESTDTEEHTGEAHSFTGNFIYFINRR